MRAGRARDGHSPPRSRHRRSTIRCRDGYGSCPSTAATPWRRQPSAAVPGRPVLATCSMNRNSPPGRNSECSCRRTPSGSSIEQSTSEHTTASNGSPPVVVHVLLDGARRHRHRNRRLSRGVASQWLQPPFGFDGDDLGHRVRIEREVRPGPGADFQHAARTGLRGSRVRSRCISSVSWLDRNVQSRAKNGLSVVSGASVTTSSRAVGDSAASRPSAEARRRRLRRAPARCGPGTPPTTSGRRTPRRHPMEDTAWRSAAQQRREQRSAVEAPRWSGRHGG